MPSGVGFSQQAFVGVEVGGGAEGCALPAALTDGLADAPTKRVIAIAGDLGLVAVGDLDEPLGNVVGVALTGDE